MRLPFALNISVSSAIRLLLKNIHRPTFGQKYSKLASFTPNVVKDVVHQYQQPKTNIILKKDVAINCICTVTFTSDLQDHVHSFFLVVDGVTVDIRIKT